MKIDPTFLIRAVCVAAVAFSGLTLTYGDSEYAAVGPVSVTTEMLMKVVPGLAALVVPLIMQKWPALASMARFAVLILKYRNPELATALEKITSLEVIAKQAGDTEAIAACGTLRTKLLSNVE